MSNNKPIANNILNKISKLKISKNIDLSGFSVHVGDLYEASQDDIMQINSLLKYKKINMKQFKKLLIEIEVNLFEHAMYHLNHLKKEIKHLNEFINVITNNKYDKGEGASSHNRADTCNMSKP